MKKQSQLPTPTVSLQDRAAGILLHPTSLANPFSIGDLGPAAYSFIDFLAASGLRWWQMLPIGPVGLDASPYQAYSAFAGNALLISPDLLARMKWVDHEDLKTCRSSARPHVDFKRASGCKDLLLRRAFASFESRPHPLQHPEFEAFQKSEAWWLEDYTLFCTLQKHLQEKDWTRWPQPFRDRVPAALRKAKTSVASELRFFAFREWVFDSQWKALRAYAAARGIAFLGDVPIFVAPGSCDVWAHRDIFQLRLDGKPRVVSGVAPDYFSKTGQRWGNPHYRWSRLKKQGYRWWVDRFRKNLDYFDALRLDHFIGFIRYYEVPGDAPTAEHGRYRKGPGADFFKSVLSSLGVSHPIFVAEDLGIVTPEVKAIRDTFHFPGMKVLQFAFGNDPEAKNYQPHAYPNNCVVYTGTHDNDTTVGWFKDTASPSSTRSKKDIAAEKAFTLEYLDCDSEEIHWAMIRAAFASAANTAIVPMQDFLGLGSKARMNRPGTPSENWGWRLGRGAISLQLAKRIRRLTGMFGRINRVGAP